MHKLVEKEEYAHSRQSTVTSPLRTTTCTILRSSVKRPRKKKSNFLYLDSITVPTASYPNCRNPTLAKCGGEAQHLEKVKIGVLRDSRNSEDNLEDQNTSPWGVLGVIGKVLKRRYRKCPRILDLDICSPSYGQKKGRESNWQFDSRPLKVGNPPAPNVRFGSAIWRWKDLDEGYSFGSNLVAIRGQGEEL